MTTAILGAGLMGSAAISRLREKGLDLIAWNRSPEKLEALNRQGVATCDNLEKTVATADTLLVFLSDAKAIASVLFSLPDSALCGKTVVQMGTISPAESRTLLQRLEALNANYLEAPVLGSLPEARAGTLLIMVGASDEQFRQNLPLLRALGQSPQLIGSVGKAAALKLAMNQMIAGLTASFALSLNFIQAEDVDVGKFMEILRQSALYAPTFDKKLNKMLTSDYENPNFPLKHLDKDVKLFIEAAALHQLNTAMLEGASKIIEDGLQQGHGDQDYSALRESI